MVIEEEDNPRERYIKKAKVFFMSHGRLPTQKEFISNGLGNRTGITKLFGNFTLLLKQVDTTGKMSSTDKLMLEDMDILVTIMRIFKIDPVKNAKFIPSPVNKLIFCNILADKYPELRDIGQASTWNKKSIKTPVAKYLGYGSNNAVKAQLREGAIESIKDYKDYYAKYKMVKAGFEGDSRYLEIEAQQIIRDNAQAKMTELTKDIIK